MKITQQIIVFDTDDLEAESAFWAGVLNGTVEADEDWHTVLVDGEPRLGFQLAPNHVRPEWPQGQPQQIHLDLYVEDVASAHEHVVGLGARQLQTKHAADDPSGFWVYADPSGHPFCLCWG
jgi:predicted enzyme related to lactoylglutathione lyase